jgi:hypothetical protein
MSDAEPDFREWGRRLLAKPRGRLPEPKLYARREKIRALIAHPDTPPAERQAAIKALAGIDRQMRRS